VSASEQRCAGLIAGIGVGTAGGNSFSILALTQLPGLVFFPLRQRGLVLVMWLVGILLYKEKVTKRGLIMLATGMMGLILINLG
jgi:glucose uptake protein GlcU